MSVQTYQQPETASGPCQQGPVEMEKGGCKGTSLMNRLFKRNCAAHFGGKERGTSESEEPSSSAVTCRAPLAILDELHKEMLASSLVPVSNPTPVDDLSLNSEVSTNPQIGKSVNKHFVESESSQKENKGKEENPLVQYIENLRLNEWRVRQTPKKKIDLYPAPKRLDFKESADEVSSTLISDPISSEKNEKVAELNVSTPPLPLNEPVLAKDSKNALILAVDATPTRVGGLLRLPGQERTIFFYSVDWSSHFDFGGDSTKFEMANTALALQLFTPIIKAYRPRYEKFIVKTDSHFFGSAKGFKDPFDCEFLGHILGIVRSLEGEFMHVFVSTHDPDIINADYLSRTELPLRLKVAYEENAGSHAAGGNAENGSNEYAFINLSEACHKYALDVIRNEMPGKYFKDYQFI